MTDDALQRIEQWCEAEASLDFTPGDPPTIVIAGPDPVAVSVAVTDDRVSLTHVGSYKGGGPLATEIREHIGGRSSLLTGTAAASGGKVKVTLDNHVYLDGLNRQAFVMAVLEIAGAVDGIGALGAVSRDESPAAIVEDTALDAEEEAAAAAEALETAAAAEPVVETAAAAETAAAVTTAAAAMWVPTHRVPEGGMRAWAAPDPSQDSVANLAARVELSIDEIRGAWAKVTGSNGWTGWVDNRRLEAMAAGAAVTAGAAVPAQAAASAPAKSATPALTIPFVALIPGIAAVVAAFLPWIQGAGNTGFDWSVGTLFSQDTLRTAVFAGGDGGFSLGILVLLAGAAMVAAVLSQQVPQKAGLAGGVLALLIGVAFVVQVILLVLDLDQSFMDALTDGIGAGPWVTIVAGGLGIVMGRKTA